MSIRGSFLHRGISHVAVLAGTVLLLSAIPATASALSLHTPADPFRVAEVGATLGSGETTGLAMLFVDNTFAAAAPIDLSGTTTFTAVPVAAGPRVLSLVVRGSGATIRSAPVAIRAWGIPAVPTPTGVRCPSFSAKVTTLPLSPDWSTATLTVSVNGREAYARAFTAPVRVAPRVSVNDTPTVVTIRASNRYVSSAATLRLIRPTWPLPAQARRITSPFGWRRHPILGTLRFHAGLDLGAPQGANIVAGGDGTVVFAGWAGGYGNFTMIDHGDGIVSCYGHQSRIVVKAGQHVVRGQRIGYVGSTGLSTGPHLHFEVRDNGTPVDPLGYL